MFKKTLYVFLAINSANLLACDKENTPIRRIPNNKRSYTDLPTQATLKQTVKKSESNEQAQQLNPKPNDLPKTDLQTDDHEWARRTPLQRCLTIPNENDRLHIWPQDNVQLEKPLSPGRALSSDESDYNNLGSPAYLGAYSSSDDDDKHLQDHSRSSTHANKDRVPAHTQPAASYTLLSGLVSSIRCIKEPKNSCADQLEQWCEYHDRSETCGACAAPTYYYGHERSGNDSK